MILQKTRIQKELQTKKKDKGRLPYTKTPDDVSDADKGARVDGESATLLRKRAQLRNIYSR
jgi:hypothetical protein